MTDGSIASIGTIFANLTVPDFVIQHKFHVVPNQFNIPSDGILGKDFIKRLRCRIDYDNMTITLRINDSQVNIPIREGPRTGTTMLPARSEVIRKFNIRNFCPDSPQVIDSQEVESGVFIARTIAHSATPLIRVVNTNHEPRIISNCISKTEALSDFRIYCMNDANDNSNRTEELLKIFEKRTPTHVKKELLSLCAEYSDIFALDTDQMTVNNFYEQKFRLTDSEPVYVKNYRLPHTQKSEIDTQVNKLLKNNLIEPSQSNYNSPLILVPKKSTDGSKRWRMCVDYRLVNKKLVADKFPLPRIDDVLDGLGRARFFSVIDLYSGFHQIPIHEASRDITSFSTSNGSYRWKVLPFGLNVSPNSFSRMMSLAFSGLSYEQAFLYMDDIIVIGCSENHHLKNLRNVFGVCRKYNLKLNPNKCEFFRPEVNFLGHRCTSKGLLPDEGKMEAVKKYPTPHDKDATRRFVAFANYYRRFIRDFAKLVRPLNGLTRKEVDFIWSKECDHSFQTLKSKLISPPILQYPDFAKPFLVTVDASNLACGAVLSQNFNGQDLPIYFASKGFNKAEKNKSTIEKELIAIHFAVNHFRPYIYGTNFVVRSDHRPLIFLYKLKNPSSKLTRIRLDLEEYNFTVEYIRGKDNVAADALSRISIEDLKNLYPPSASVLKIMTRSMTRKLRQQNLVEQDRPQEISEIGRVRITEEFGSSFIRTIPRIICRNLNLESRDNMSQGSPRKRKLCAHVGHRKLFDIDLEKTIINEKLDLAAVFSKLQRIAKDKKIGKIQWPLNDEIFKCYTVNKFKEIGEANLEDLQIVLISSPTQITDENERLQLINRFHNDPIFGGHCGQKKLYAKLRRYYYWKNMTKDVAKFVRNCEKCRLNKVRPSTTEPLVLTPTPQTAFDIVIIDTIGPFKPSYQGNVYAVTLICELTKYVVAVPIPNKEAKTVARAIFEHFILIYGPMRQITTDLGTEYKNEVMKELCTLLKIEHRLSTAYRHQTLGTIERNHRVFNEYIRAYISDNIEQWEEFLKYFVFCYNTTNNASLDHKYTPYELVFNKSLNLPCNLQNGEIEPIYNVENFVKEAKFRLQSAQKEAKRLIEKMKERNKLLFDKNAKPINLQLNEQVLVEKEPYHKHKPIYMGPFVVKRITDSNVELIDPKTNKITLVHKNRIRKLKN